jgi:hypothetical protein
LTLVNLGDTLARFRVGRGGGKRHPSDGETRDYHSVEEAGKLIDPPVTRQAVHQWIKRGVNGTKLEAFRVGRAYLVQHSALEAFCKATGKKLKA